MPNTFLTAQEIARATLPLLKANLVFPALSHNDFSEAFAHKGDTVQVRKPPVYHANEFGGSISVQDVSEQNVLVTMDKIADVSVALTSKELTLSLESLKKSVLEPAAVALAEKINADGLALYKDIPYVVGTAGTTPDGLDDFANAAKSLNDRKAPMGDRYAVWNSAALAEFQQLPAFVNAEKSGTTKALRQGAIGRVIGFDNYMSQQVCSHTAGTLAATTSLQIQADAVKGATQIVINASSSGTLSGTLVKGDILTVDGNTYAVTEAAEIKSAKITAKIYPALAANVSSGTEVTLTGDHAANLAFNRNAFGFVSRPLEKALGAESYVTSYDGISLRVTFDYDIDTKTQTLSIDTLYGFKTLYPELAVRVLG